MTRRMIPTIYPADLNSLHIPVTVIFQIRSISNMSRPATFVHFPRYPELLPCEKVLLVPYFFNLPDRDANQLCTVRL